MMGEKVLITYKRKRLSANANPVHVKADLTVKTIGEDCFRCGSVDVNENLLVCHSCSGSYHLRCIDSHSEYIPEERWLCSACTKRYNVEVSLQYRSHPSDKVKEKKFVGESETTSVKMSPQQALLHSKSLKGNSSEGVSFSVEPPIKKIKDAASADNLDTNFGSACGVVEETLRSETTNLETVGISSSTRLNTWTERNIGCRFTEDHVSVVGCSDKRSGIKRNDDYRKATANLSLITFHRRYKKKKDVDVADGSIARNSMDKEKQSLMVISSSHDLGDCCKCVDSTVLSEADRPSRLQTVQQNMQEGRKDAGLELKLTGQGAGNKHKEQCTQRPDVDFQDVLPSQLSENVLHCQCDKSIETPTSDGINDPTLLHKSKQSGMVNTDTSKREEKENDLVSEERGLVSGGEIFVAPAVPTYLANSKPRKLFADVIAENFLESQSSSSQNCNLVAVDEETDGRAKGSQWMETTDKALEEAKGVCTSNPMDESRIDRRLASNGRASSINPINSSIKSLLIQDVPKECMNQISRLPERLLMANSNNSTHGRQQHERASINSIYTDFLDLSLPLDPEVHDASANALRTMSLTADLCLKDTVRKYNRQFRLHSMGENASVSRQKQVFENDLIGSQMLKGTTMLDKFQRFSHEWSEEELDFLWIGVRRHGLNNWSAILRDPKFCFLESRVPEDLAEQWDKEQIKLLNGTLCQPARSTLDVSGPLSMDDTCWGRTTAGNLCSEKIVSSYLEFSTPRAETKLSLGGVYVQSENNTMRNCPHLAGLSLLNPLALKNSNPSPFVGSNLIGSSNSRPGTRHQKAFKRRYNRYDCDSSPSPQKPVEKVASEQRSTNSSLPHWLKEVLTMPQRQSSILLPAGVSSISSTSMINNDERVGVFPSADEPPAPPKDSRGRGILKRKSTASRKNSSGVKMPKNSVSMDNPSLQRRFSLLPNLGLTPPKPTSIGPGPSDDILDLNNACSDPIGPNNLVVIDSDASSEETISDDQGSIW